MGFKLKNVIYQNVWLISLFLGCIGFVYIYFMLEHTNVISLSGFMFRILIFLFLILSVAFFPNKSKRSYLWLIVPIVIYLGVIGVKIDNVGYKELLPGLKDAWRHYYVMIYLILYPFILLTLIFGFRIGGGSSANTIKIGITGILVLFSGFLDVIYQFIYPGIIPAVNTDNYFYKSILGYFPTHQQEVIFCLAFVPLIIGVLYLPIEKWINKAFGQYI